MGALDHESVGINPLEWLDEKFCSYIDDRRREPRNDILTSLTTAKYPDGSTPEVIDVVRSATFLFRCRTGNHRQTAQLRAAGMGDRPEIQQRFRADRSLIPGFIEESLRMESPVKSDSRLARKATRIGGVDIAAGTVVMVLPGAANRDPRRFDDPHEFRPRPKERPRAHGFCAWSPLVPGWTARPGGRPCLDRAPSGPDGRHQDRRSPPRAEPPIAATPTSRRISCEA